MSAWGIPAVLLFPLSFQRGEQRQQFLKQFDFISWPYVGVFRFSRRIVPTRVNAGVIASKNVAGQAVPNHQASLFVRLPKIRQIEKSVKEFLPRFLDSYFLADANDVEILFCLG